MSAQLLTRADAARRLRVTPETVRRLQSEGRLAPAMVTGRSCWYAPAEVEALAAERAAEPSRLARPTPVPPGYVSVTEAAALLGVLRGAVQTAIQRGTIAAERIRMGGQNRWILREEDVLARREERQVAQARAIANRELLVAQLRAEGGAR